MSAKEDVYLNLYHRPAYKILNPLILSCIGIGVYHSAVQVYNREYSFGGHCLDFSGIYENEPRNAVIKEVLGIKFRESIHLGVTGLSRTEVRDIVRDMGNEYKAETYHLLTRNCHNFSNALLNLLCDISLPLWVNRMARTLSRVSFLTRLECCGIVITADEQEIRETFDELKKTARETHGKKCAVCFEVDKLWVYFSLYSNTVIIEELKK